MHGGRLKRLLANGFNVDDWLCYPAQGAILIATYEVNTPFRRRLYSSSSFVTAAAVGYTTVQSSKRPLCIAMNIREQQCWSAAFH